MAKNGTRVEMSGRDKTIDGFRALAALGVVFAHAVSYRLAEIAFPGASILQRLADPLAQTSRYFSSSADT